MKTFAIYIRSNKDNITHEEQRAACEKYVEDEGGKIHHIYKDIASGSPKGMRKQYQKLLESIAQKEIDAILANDLVRFARRPTDIDYLINLCAIHGVQICSVSDGNIDTSALNYPAHQSPSGNQTLEGGDNA